ncbi:MAG TPA: AzlD domain-containing protein [Usitatibacter sp.]|jgi:branched-subunit amino acid transport protein|nr:AzlD domain-containing protein [Usitatibacter sp.]
MSVWIAIAGVSFSTFFLRASFMLFADPHRFPHWFRHALKFVPAAVLAAIVAPGLLMAGGTPDLSLANPRLVAGLIAMVATFYLRNTFAAVATGMAALWALQWAFGHFG